MKIFKESGDMVYEQADIPWLRKKVTVHDYPLRYYAAAGLMRALLDTPPTVRDEAFLASLEWAGKVIIHVQQQRDAIPLATNEINTYMDNLGPVNGYLDTISLDATAANIPKFSSKVIDNHIPPTEAKLIIGLGHGGILSSMLTFTALSGSNNAYYPVRFSRHKQHDREPVLSDSEIDYLKALSSARVVIVHDEDRSAFGTTIQQAVRHIGTKLDVHTFGYTPVESQQPGMFLPEMIQYKQNAH